MKKILYTILKITDDYRSILPGLIVGLVFLSAIITTKIPILTEQGFWQMARASRTDFAMTLLCIFLLIYGAGQLSADYFLQRK